MTSCGRCIGGYWMGKRAYPCFSCHGTGVAKVRQSRARRTAEAASTGMLLQIDAMPTLAEVQAGRLLMGSVLRPGSVISKLGAGAQRLRAARVRLLHAPAPVVLPVSSTANIMSRPFRDDSVVQRNDVGRERTYIEIFGEG